jgi:hypothetical protein
MAEMTRREVLQGVVALFGGAALKDVDGLLARYGEPARAAVMRVGIGPFTAADIAFLDEVAGTILPETGTPGAKAAKTGAFMALMVTDTYSEPDQQVFRDGMKSLDETCRKAHGTGFMKATPAQRKTLLESVDREQYDYTRQKKSDDPPHYFRQMKWLSLQGYFTSEVGYTQAMRYLETPGRFDPCVPCSPGEKIWASHA